MPVDNMGEYISFCKWGSILVQAEVWRADLLRLLPFQAFVFSRLRVLLGVGGSNLQTHVNTKLSRLGERCGTK
jgi:hypothetical protein